MKLNKRLKLNKRQKDNMARYLASQCHHMESFEAPQGIATNARILKQAEAINKFFYKGCIIGYCTARGLQYHWYCTDDLVEVLDVTGAGGTLLFRHEFKEKGGAEESECGQRD